MQKKARFKDATVRARIESWLKEEVEAILKELGTSHTEVINLLYHQIRHHKSIPFEVKMPNEETLKVFRESDAGIGLVEHKNAKEMRKLLDSQHR